MSPIRPEDRHRYPKDWHKIAKMVKERAGWKCECRGECGLHEEHGCQAYHGQPRHGKRSVVLTVAHLDHTPENSTDDNLKAMCEGCHNRYDMPTRIARRKVRTMRQEEEK